MDRSGQQTRTPEDAQRENRVRPLPPFLRQAGAYESPRPTPSPPTPSPPTPSPPTPSPPTSIRARLTSILTVSWLSLRRNKQAGTGTDHESRRAAYLIWEWFLRQPETFHVTGVFTFLRATTNRPSLGTGILAIEEGDLIGVFRGPTGVLDLDDPKLWVIGWNRRTTYKGVVSIKDRRETEAELHRPPALDNASSRPPSVLEEQPQQAQAAEPVPVVVQNVAAAELVVVAQRGAAAQRAAAVQPVAAVQPAAAVQSGAAAPQPDAAAAGPAVVNPNDMTWDLILMRLSQLEEQARSRYLAAADANYRLEQNRPDRRAAPAFTAPRPAPVITQEELRDFNTLSAYAVLRLQRGQADQAATPAFIAPRPAAAAAAREDHGPFQALTVAAKAATEQKSNDESNRTSFFPDIRRFWKAKAPDAPCPDVFCEMCKVNRLSLPAINHTPSNPALADAEGWEDPVVVFCGHVFGADCLVAWYDHRKPQTWRCPLCKRGLVYSECKHDATGINMAGFEALTWDKVPTTVREGGGKLPDRCDPCKLKEVRKLKNHLHDAVPRASGEMGAVDGYNSELERADVLNMHSAFRRYLDGLESGAYGGSWGKPFHR